MSIYEKEPIEIFSKEPNLKKYEEYREAVWQQLTGINTNLFILGKFMKYPEDCWEWVVGKTNVGLLTTIQANLGENVIVKFCRVYLERQKKPITLQRLKRFVCHHIKPELRSDFETKLERLEKSEDKRFPDDLKDILVTLRDRRLVHWDASGKVHIQPIPFNEMIEACEYLNDLFELLCFAHMFAVLPIDYYLAKHEGKKDTDMDWLIEIMVRDSVLFNDGDTWEIFKDKLPQSAIEMLNEFRVKNNLPPRYGSNTT